MVLDQQEVTDTALKFLRTYEIIRNTPYRVVSDDCGHFVFVYPTIEETRKFFPLVPLVKLKRESELYRNRMECIFFEDKITSKLDFLTSVLKYLLLVNNCK